MKTNVIEVTGWRGAFTSMFMSKRTWTPELGREINAVCNLVLGDGGFPRNEGDPLVPKEAYEKFMEWTNMALRMSTEHITIGKFISFTGVVQGLHRAGQDDFDAHACRYWNRIIRNSTRLATFEDDEMSDFYRGKIITTDKALEILGMDIPEKIEYEGEIYVKAPNGYIREDLKDNKDVRRGLYMLSIPSNFVFECSLTEWGHVLKERGYHGGANPELKDCAESLTANLTEICPAFTRDWFMNVKN